ncbi:MAG: insulinase family protein [Deltaproteobacteria bacterium]|nr:insulinase family protein [Deltaproteobacteria bacterium]
MKIAMILLSAMAVTLLSCKGEWLSRIGGQGKLLAPHWKEAELPNKAKGVVYEDHSVPIIYYRAVIRSGSAAEPPDKPGLANLTGELLLRGTKSHTRDEIFSQLEGMGATLEVETSYDFLSYSGSVLSKNKDRFLKILAEILIQPTFPAEELTKLRHEVMAQIQEQLDKDREVVNLHFRRALFGDHPYSRPVLGTPQSIPNITLTDIMTFYRENFVSGNMILESAGDISKGDAINDFELLFAGLPPGEMRQSQYGEFKPTEQNRVFLIDKPQRTQTQIMIGQVGIPANDPDYIPLTVMSTAFGGTFTAPLNDEIRIKRGWSYGAFSYLRSWKDPGFFAMWTFPANKDTVPAIELALDLYRRFIDKGVKENEFTHATEHLVNSYPFDWDTPGDILSLATQRIIFDLPRDYYLTYTDRIRGLQLQSAHEILKRRLRKEPLTIAIVCDAKDFFQKVSAFGQVAVRRYDE